VGGVGLKLSRERLLAEAASSGFRPEVFEKVSYLFSLFEGLWSHPFLKKRLVLKGGTALNLFIFDLPRLSVDIDLNYVGSPHKDIMLAERPRIEEAIRAVCQREGLTIRRYPSEHAGGKWSLRYESALGQGGNLAIDLNFMFRVPLWPITPCDSRPIGSYRAKQIPLLNEHEIGAGKLCALLSRHAGRDLFDAHQLLTRKVLKRDRLRPAFVIYGAMNRKDWRTVSEKDIGFDTNEIMNELIPVLRSDERKLTLDRERWASRLVEECRQALSIVLPFTKNEREFLNRILDYGEIEPSSITSDEKMANLIRNHPGLHWKALNVRKFKRIE